MLLLVFAATAASTPHLMPDVRTSAVVQARATVRIVSAVRLHWGEEQRSGDTPSPRKTVVQTASGPEPAQLIEFE